MKKALYIFLLNLCFCAAFAQQTGIELPDPQRDYTNQIDSVNLNLQNIFNHIDTNYFQVTINDSSGINISIDSTQFLNLVAEFDSLKLCVDLNNELDSIRNDQLDSLLSVFSTVEDSCYCEVSIRNENWSVSVDENTRFGRLNFEEVIYKDCGEGKEIYQRFNNSSNTNISSGYRYVNSTPLINGGFIDKVTFNTLNPGGLLVVDLNPSTVLTTYPSLSINSSDLIYNTSNITSYIAAFQAVVTQAISDFEIANTLAVNSTLYNINIAFNSNIFRISTDMYNVVSSPFVAIDPSNASFVYYPDGINVINSNFIDNYNSGILYESSYATSCGITRVRYNNDMSSVNAPDFGVLPSPDFPANLILEEVTNCWFYGSDCPEVPGGLDVSVNGCVSICKEVYVKDTTNHAIQKEILEAIENIELDTTCDVKAENETYYINGTNGINFSANTIWSYSITVLEGEVKFAENAVAAPFLLPKGYSGGQTAPECKFLTNLVEWGGTTPDTKAIIKIIR